MHPGVADAAERDEVCQGVMCRVQVDVMDVEVFGSAADGALLPVAFQDRGPHRLPPPESVLLPRLMEIPNSSQKTEPSSRTANGHW